MNLTEQFERLCQDTTSDIYEYLPIFFGAAIAVPPPGPIIIELGVRAGCSTIAWLFAIESIGRGHLYSVDGAPPCLDTDDTDLLGQYMNEERDESTLPFWTFYKGWDNDQWVIDNLPQANIVFVDTNHTYEMTTDELATYYPKIFSGGTMFFHDTNIIETGNASTPQPAYPVRTAVEEFCNLHNLPVHFIEDRCGLGRIFKP